MLLGEDRRRREDGDLLAVHHGLERRAQRNLRFAVAHVAAEQAIHRQVALHVALDLLRGLKLVGRFVVGEVFLKFLLPRRVRPKGVAPVLLPLGVELHEVEGQLLEAFAHLRFLLVPVLAAQPRELGAAPSPPPMYF